MVTNEEKLSKFNQAIHHYARNSAGRLKKK